MAILVQKAYLASGAATTQTLTLPGSATAGNTIILVIGWTDTGTNTAGVLPTPTDANGTYSAALNPTSQGGNGASGTSIFYVPNCTTGTHSSVISSITGGANDLYVSGGIFEYSGILTASPFDQSAHNGTGANGAATSMSMTSGSLAQSNEFVICGCALNANTGLANAGITVPSAFTAVPGQPSNFQVTTTFLGQQIGTLDPAGSTSAITAVYNWSTDASLSLVTIGLATFKEAAAGGNTASVAWVT